MNRTTLFIALSAVAVVAACSDAPPPTAPARLAPEASADLRFPRSTERYVAIGTSVTMGWASNGVYATSQSTSWPAQLAFGTGTPLSLPLIQSPGCTSPLIAPLIANKRLSGEPFAGSVTCAPNAAGVTLPAQNVGLAGALAADVLLRVADNSPQFPWYARVLPSNTTALMAALGQQPTLVSVELGANEVLGVTSGLFLPGTTVASFPDQFVPPYVAILEQLKAANTKAVLVGLPSDATHLPALRRADEIWAERGAFALLHVTVSPDCATSPNYINVSVASLNAVYMGAAAHAAGQPNFTFSCADHPFTPDLVLTPDDITHTNILLGQITDFIKGQAAARGYAYFSLGAIYDRPEVKGGRYSILNQLISPLPYGPYVSLDGVHPNPLGHTLLALAAAGAISATYGGGVHALRSATFTGQLTAPVDPAEALDLARKVAREHAGEQLAPCSMPGGCRLGGFKLR